MSRFLEFSDDGEHTVIRNRSGVFLGIISFDTEWRKWVWEIEGFRFDKECIDDISAKLGEKKNG